MRTAEIRELAGVYKFFGKYGKFFVVHVFFPAVHRVSTQGNGVEFVQIHLLVFRRNFEDFVADVVNFLRSDRKVVDDVAESCFCTQILHWRAVIGKDDAAGQFFRDFTQADGLTPGDDTAVYGSRKKNGFIDTGFFDPLQN